MRKIGKYCANVLGWMIFIGFTVQIVLGMLWMYNAFAGLRGFGEGIVCVGQIVLAGGAAFYFLHSIGVRRRWLKFFGSLAVITFPMTMQCHVAMGIQSVVSSLLLFMSGWMIGDGGKGKFRYRLLLFLVAAGLVLGTDRTYQGKRGIAVCIASRFAWTTLMQTQLFWPQEYRDEIPLYIVLQSSYEADGIQRILAPYLRESLGEKEAGKTLRELSSLAWRWYKRRILKEITWDVAGYTVPPLVVPLQLKGRAYDSYTGINYRDILRPNPRLGRAYMDYGCWWFKMGLAITVLLFLGDPRSLRFRNAVTAILIGGLMVVVYTMGGAGCMDYRNTAYILCVWLAVMVKIAGRSLGLSGGQIDG